MKENRLNTRAYRVSFAGSWTRSRASFAAMLGAWSVMVGACVELEPSVQSEAPMPLPETVVEEVEAADAAVVDDAFEGEDVGHDAGRLRRVRRTESTPGTLFVPADDEAVIERLRTEEIVLVERGRGGRSVAFRFTLASGARAYFKPEQTFSGTHWYAEIAAFHLDRLIALNRTAPSTGRVVPWALLEPALAGDPRASEVIVGDDGLVRGVIVAWIDERLVPIEPPAGWAEDLRLTHHVGVFPFVPPAALLRAHTAFLALDAGVISSDASADDAGPASNLDGSVDAGMTARSWSADRRAAELSTLVVFDFLIHNGDRWGGNFTNVRTRGVDGPIVYLDNAAGFSRRRARLTTLDLRLLFVERFEAGVIRRIRRLDEDALRDRLATEPLAPILDDDQLAHFEERRSALLAHVDATAERLGRERVLAWP